MIAKHFTHRFPFLIWATPANYLLAVVIASVMLTFWLVLDSAPSLEELGNAIPLFLVLSAAYGLIPYSFMGFVYLVFAYPGWGEREPLIFTLVGGVIGAFPYALATIFGLALELAVVGGLAGLGCALLWHVSALRFRDQLAHD